MKNVNAAYRWVVVVMTLALVASSGVACRPPSRGAGDAAAGRSAKTAPDFELSGVDGKTVRLSDFKGKVVLLDFWATWCPPCRKEIPGFIDLQKRYASQGFTVVGVALDQGGVAAVQQFAAQLGINYPLAMGDAEVANAYGGIQAIPTTFLIGRQGAILQTYVGAHDAETFERGIQAALR